MKEIQVVEIAPGQFERKSRAWCIDDDGVVWVTKNSMEDVPEWELETDEDEIKCVRLWRFGADS